ncbi:uncharacterized protein LOC121382784 isoform X2 [Gigantopelta aegis]|uniref:uncharacterized protein LOC121382784 isoform X2 n=1 Tax=Gigantopelta aegis TaxID=1735272 RepID=UPI001B8889E3|nr:uncharacterized protein LOC121382784 isoform X2 [Gigantopelta aegis]
MVALNATAAFRIKLDIYAEKIRIHPDTWHRRACFRAELFGCDPPDFGFSLVNVVGCSTTGSEYLVECLPGHNDVLVTSGTVTHLENQCHEHLLYIHENSCAKLPLTLTCFKDPDSCPNGFTISVNVKLDTESPRYILSTSREHHDHTGLTLFYQNDMLTGTVQLARTTWLVSTLHTLNTGTWHWLEITWSSTHGLKLFAEGQLIASSPSPSLTETSRIHSDHMTIGCSDNVHTTYGGIWIKKLVLSPLSREHLVQSSPYIHDVQGLPDSLCGEMTATPGHGSTLSTAPTTPSTLSTTGSTTPSTTPKPIPTLEPIPECNIPLWNRNFTANDVTTSSDGYNTSAATSMIDCCLGKLRGGWCPDPNTLSSPTRPFIEVRFKQPIAIQSIEIQPPEVNSPTSRVTKYLTTYSVQYEPLHSHYLKTLSSQSGPVLFRGVDVNGIAIVSAITSIPAVVTKRIRLVTVGYHGDPCFRFQLFGCHREVLCPGGCEHGGECFTKDTCKCPVPYFGNRCEKSHLLPGSEHNGAWCPAPSDTNPYYEVKFHQKMAISEIMFDFPARKHDFDVHDTFMTKYSIYYRTHRILHLYASNLQAIYNSTVTFTDDFYPYIKALALRIVPTAWEKAPCFRFEVIGCNADEVEHIIVGKRKRRELSPRVNLKGHN